MDLPIKRRCYIGAKCRGNSSTVLTGCHPSCPPRVPPLPMKRATSPQWYVSVSHCYDQSDIRVAVRMKHKTQGLSWVDLSSCELNTPFTAMLARLCIKNQRMNESFILVIHADEQNVTIVTCADMQLTRHHHKCLQNSISHNHHLPSPYNNPEYQQYGSTKKNPHTMIYPNCNHLLNEL